MAEVCKEAMWLASLLITNDRWFAESMIQLAWEKNQIESLMKSWLYKWDRMKTLNERLHTIDKKIDLWVQAKLLARQWKFYSLWAEARTHLLEELGKAWWQVDAANAVVEAIISREPKNAEELAMIFADWDMEKYNQIFKNFDESLARYVIAQDTMRIEQWIKRELSDKLASIEKKHMNTKKWTSEWKVKKVAKSWKPVGETTKKTDIIEWTATDTNPNVTQPSLFRRYNWIEDIETLTEKEVRQIVYRYFDSDEVTVVFCNNLMTPEWQLALWAYSEWMIRFVKFPNKYTPEHEVVHAYIDLCMSKEEKRAFLWYVMADGWYKQKIEKRLDSNKLPHTVENYLIAAEEVVADWFIKFVKRKETFVWRVKSFFEELWYRIKKIFWNEDYVRSLYKDIEWKVRRPEIFRGSKMMNGIKRDWKNLIDNFSKEFKTPKEVRDFVNDRLWFVDRKTWEEASEIYDESIAYTILWYDTNIDWTSLVVSYEPTVWMYWKTILWVNWLYNHGTHSIIVWNWKYTMPHEMTHALDRIFYQELFWIRESRPLTFGVMKDLSMLTGIRKDLAEEFLWIFEDVIKESKNNTLFSKVRKMWWKKYFNSLSEIYARFWEAFIHKQVTWKWVTYVSEKFSDDLFNRYTDWLSHMADARSKWLLYSPNRLTTQWNNVMFKRAEKSAKENITLKKIKNDPALQVEYNNRVNTMRFIQQLNAENMESLKNFWWFFASEDWLFWTALIKDMWDSMIELAMPYLKNWEDINTMTVADLRRRMQEVQERFKNAHKQSNVIAQMEKEREDLESMRWEIFRVDDLVSEMWVVYKAEWRITKEWLNALIRDSLSEDDLSKTPTEDVIKAKPTQSATKIDTSWKWWKWAKTVDKREEWEKAAQSWEELEKRWTEKVDTKDYTNPDINDPATKTELSNEAEAELRDNIKKDVEQVLKWESPSNVASADEIWKEFWEKSDDVVERERNLNNFLLWKIFLWEEDDVLESAMRMLDWSNIEDFWKLTLAQIDKITDLSQLEYVVFSHIWDLIYDKEIRQALKDKQYQLWTTVKPEDIAKQSEILSKSRSMQKTAEFLEAWWQYTDVSLYDRVWNALRWIFDFDSTVNNRDLYDQFTTAITNFNSNRKIKTAKVWWIDMDANALVKWLYAISWSDLVKDVASVKADPKDQLRVAAKRLFDIWDEKAAKAAEKRIDDLFNSISPQDLTNADITKLAYTTTSAVKIEWEMTDNNVVFYNYRDWLYAQDPQTTYWEFFDEIAKQNSIIIDDEHHVKEAFKVSEIPADTKYIIVNDINWRDDKELKDFIYSLPEENRPQVIYPRWWMMGNYYVEWWKVKFKTTSNQLYNEITRNASAQTLWTFARNIENPTKETMEELENKALEYFRTMMWLDMKWAPVDKAEYKARIVNNLRVITWLPISAEMDVYNPKSTWKMASDIIRYQLWATWKYTKVIKNVEDTVTDIANRFSNDRVWLFRDIKAIVWWNDDIMIKNADAIRDAYINYSIAPSIEAKIQSKWILMALCNWWEYEKIDVNLFNAALIKDDFVSVLWPVIYWQREYTDAEIRALNSLWDDILSSYIFDLWSNIIKNWWYSMPLISPASTIRKLLKWENIMSEDFVQAFIKKNWLQENHNVIESILNDALPDELDIQMPTSTLLNSSIILPNIVVEEVPNVIIPTNYNQLLAVIRKWWSKWWWITWDEEWIIKWILDNYYRAVEDAINAWIMTPTLAQQLKLQAWWALDMAEQDLLISKYDSYLTLEERNWLMWGKYKLRIATNKDELEAVKRWNQDILNWYRSKLWEMWKDWIKTYSNIDQARKDLIEKWVIMANVWWKVVTMNVHDMLIEQLETLPDWLRWIFKSFEKLTVNDIRWIPYNQAYAIIKAIDLAKNAAARWNLYTRLMYKQNPQLANIDFFKRYKLDSDWVPFALQRNAAKLVDSTISDSLDTTIKQNTMLEISSIMRSKWRLDEDTLKDIVEKQLSWLWKDETIKNHYINMFRAYTFLTDIPKDIKNTINQMLDAQLKEIRNELSWMWTDFMEWILNSRITLTDWTDISLRDLISWDIDAYKQELFIEKWNDWVYREIKPREFTSNELWLSAEQVREYSDSMYSMLNQLDSVNSVERQLTSVILWDVRQMLNKYTTTKRLIDADYLIWWQNDLLRNLIKSNAFSWWWQLWWDQDLISKIWSKATWQSFFNKDNWNTIKEYYYTYYRQNLDVLEKMQVSNDFQATALEMAKYFKRIENTLGSVDWIKWASINTELNRAFWRIWSIILNVNTASQVHSLMNAIWNNQILAFFKFAKKWDWAYFDLFSDMKMSRLKWAWVEYIREVELNDVKRFNELFNTNFDRNEYVVIMQALWWYKIWWPAQQWVNWVLRWINFSSSLARALMSYPFQLFTIAPQSIAYNLKANAYKRALWIEDMSSTNRIREFYDILTSEYVELNPKWWATSQMKNVLYKYTWKEVQDMMQKEWVNTDDSIVELFGKSYDHAQKNYTWQQIVQLFDATRDNANNIIDALMAQKFKNLAFAKALKYNNVMPFNNAEAFERFMRDVNVPQDIKDRVMDSIKIYSWRIFKDMLWTWFSWLDKMYWANMAQDILIWLMNTINFRWAWWLNMFRQTAWKIWSALKAFRFVWDKRAAQQAIDFLKNTPEFSDLTQAMFNDLVRSWKLARFSDNWKMPLDDSEADFMDFCEWVLGNIEFVSQQWQWLMSFWPLRPFIAQWEAIWDHLREPQYYWDPYWIWALINTWMSNIWRNWKPVKFAVDALRVAQADWDMSSAWDYVANHWYQLSAWTLRYMIEEAYNDYWANTPLVYEVWWIPSIVRWEQWWGSDTAYLYKMRQAETWEYIKNIRAWKEWYDAKSLFWQLMNYSQFLSMNKEAIKLAWTALWKEDWKSSKSAYWLDDMDEAYKDLPERQEWRKTWFILPKHEDKYTSYYDSIINVFTEWNNPWGSKFIEWLGNFVQYWKVNPKADTNYFDAALEEFYTRIEEKEPGALKEILNNKEIMANTATSNTAWNIQIELSWAMDKLKLFEWDPEYNKYAAVIYKWTMSNVMYNELQDFAARKTDEFKAMWYLPKKKDKYSASEIKDTPELYKEFKQEFVDKHWDDLMVADVEWMQGAMFKFLAENNREVSDKFFTYNEEYDKRYLKSNLKSQVQQLIDFENAMNNWEWERAIVQWTQLTKTFSYDHTVSTQTAVYILNRIKDSDMLPEKMRLEAMTEFVANNLEAFAWDSDLAKENPELYEEVKWYYNKINYQVNQDLINAANDYALSLSSDKEKSWGKWWWSWLALKVKSLSEALRKNQEKTWWAWAGTTHTMTWIKAPILDPTKVFVEDSKVLKINFTPKAYTPKTNLGGSTKQQPTAQPVKVKTKKIKEKDIEVM